MNDRSGPRIRLFTAQDVPYAVRQATEFGWTTAPHWFTVLVEHDPRGCFLAEIDGQPVGMVTTARYGSSAWLGYLMVSPQRGALGLGTILLEYGLGYLDASGVETVLLDADPPGVRIYARHGFAKRFPSRRFRLLGSARRPATAAVCLTPDDVPAMTRLDLESFGDDRACLLALMYPTAEAAYCVRRHGRLVGYALLIASGAGVQLGPWIAEDRSAAEELLAAAVRQRADREMTVGVPGTNDAAIALLEECGFQEKPASMRMTRGQATNVCVGPQVYGLGNGAIG